MRYHGTTDTPEEHRMNTHSAPTKKRQSVTFGPVMVKLLEDGHCAASSTSERLEILAARYLALTTAIYPTWPLETWVAAITAAARIDLRAPAAGWSLMGLVRQERDSKLAYSLEALPVQQLQGVLGVAERYLAREKAVSDSSLGAWLEAAGISVQQKP